MIAFRIGKPAACDLDEFSEEKGQSVSELFRERVRGYLNGEIVFWPLAVQWDAGYGLPPASVARERPGDLASSTRRRSFAYRKILSVGCGPAPGGSARRARS